MFRVSHTCTLTIIKPSFSPPLNPTPVKYLQFIFYVAFCIFNEKNCFCSSAFGEIKNEKIYWNNKTKQNTGKRFLFRIKMLKFYDRIPPNPMHPSLRTGFSRIFFISFLFFFREKNVFFLMLQRKTRVQDESFFHPLTNPEGGRRKGDAVWNGQFFFFEKRHQNLKKIRKNF